MDLSKAFDTLNHDLLIAKLHVYGFQYDALKLLDTYLPKRWYRTNVSWSMQFDQEIRVRRFLAIEWLETNSMKINKDKCYF